MEKKEILSLMRAKSYRPLTGEELMASLGFEGQSAFQELLDTMEQEGLIVKTRKHKYGLPEKMGLVSGRVQMSNKGFAFVLPLGREREDLYISAQNLNGAMNGDLVLARLMDDATGRRPEGEIIRVLQRVNKRVVGTFDIAGELSFVVPDDQRLHQDIIIPPGHTMDAAVKDKVVVEITRWPEPRRSPEGRVIEKLGGTGQQGVDVLSIIKKYGLEPEFPPEVLQEAGGITKDFGPSELAGRINLKDWPLVTIDGADARDLDDAVSLKMLPDESYLLGVHIADVSYYVREGSYLDREAFNRATSVYFVDRVIPMLPPRLSNDICSLNAGEDRLSVTVLMTFSPGGALKKYEIFPSVIRIRERMTYDAVRGILVDGDLELCRRYRELVPVFHRMAKLAGILRQRRLRRGSIDFDFVEAKVVLDEQGLPAAIVSRPRTIAESLIEEFMIAANETVARHLYEMGVPCVYRVHEEPGADKMEELNNFLAFFGLNIKKDKEGKVKPKAFQDILNAVKGKPEERVISTVMLRSMMHARYDSQCLGHFGLSTAFYCHFTSPIRRYPDLVVHRILRETWSKEGIPATRLAAFESFVNRAASQSSEREKVAEEAERESQDMKKVQYMERHLGDTFKGVISSVLSFGFFVELENTVEGLVHVSNLTDDYYFYQQDQMCLVGGHTGRTFRMGQPVEVQVVRVDVDARKVDFELVRSEEAPRTRISRSVKPKVKPPSKRVQKHKQKKTASKKAKTLPGSRGRQNKATRKRK